MKPLHVSSTRTARRRTGYTLVEISITLAIVGILMAVSGSQYVAYLDRARTARAIAELHAIADTIDPGGDEDATYPATLADAGITTLDPWGHPYQYLLIQGNLPRGLAQRSEDLPAVAAAPAGAGTSATSGTSAGSTTGSASSPSSGSTSSGSTSTSGTAPTTTPAPTSTSTSTGGTGASSGSGSGSSAGSSGSASGGSAGSGSAGSASGGTGAGSAGAAGSAGGSGNAGGAGNAGGSGNAGGAGHAGGAGGGRGGGGRPAIAMARKDRFQVPINSDFDLYSMGPDGQSKPPLNTPVSRDDILRANDGAFYGIAEEF